MNLSEKGNTKSFAENGAGNFDIRLACVKHERTARTNLLGSTPDKRVVNMAAPVLESCH